MALPVAGSFGTLAPGCSRRDRALLSNATTIDLVLGAAQVIELRDDVVRQPGSLGDRTQTGEGVREGGDVEIVERLDAKRHHVPRPIGATEVLALSVGPDRMVEHQRRDLQRDILRGFAVERDGAVADIHVDDRSLAAHADGDAVHLRPLLERTKLLLKRLRGAGEDEQLADRLRRRVWIERLVVSAQLRAR